LNEQIVFVQDGILTLLLVYGDLHVGVKEIGEVGEMEKESVYFVPVLQGEG
jgi:hypothetical protein